MTELVNARCQQGRLILTDKAIITKLDMLGTYNVNTLPRENCTRREMKTVVMSVFGLGGTMNMIFHGRGSEHMKATMVPSKQARKIADILNGIE